MWHFEIQHRSFFLSQVLITISSDKFSQQPHSGESVYGRCRIHRGCQNGNREHPVFGLGCEGRVWGLVRLAPGFCHWPRGDWTTMVARGQTLHLVLWCGHNNGTNITLYVALLRTDLNSRTKYIAALIRSGNKHSNVFAFNVSVSCN